MTELPPYQQYCPICGHIITASNIEEAESGEHPGYLFEHDDGVDHSESDVEALYHGIN